jgi:hypothetical protein
MKKKIAIMTRRAGFNMGSSLQAFAISRFIHDLGFPNIIIRYDEYSRFPIWKIKPFINSIVYTVFSISPFIFKFIFPQKFNKLNIGHKQMKQFFDFEKKYMNLTTKEYHSTKVLAKDFNSYDACICGSDQIWNPYFYDPAYMLNFIDDLGETKKIAYAPSIGITNKDLITDEAINLIKKFNYLSCRETEATKILQDITNKPVITVLDPTLMISADIFKKMCSKQHPGNGQHYILTYFLHTNYYQDSIPYNYIRNLSKKTGLPIFNIQLFNLVNNIPAKKQFCTIGPVDFLTLVLNASWICTNSFHCSIFSFLFQKKFFVFERYMKEGGISASQNSRIYSLLKLFDMRYCLKKDLDTPNIEQKFNYESGISNLEIQQEISKKYIINALSSNEK